MDVEILARLQFALTIMFHYIYPPLSIGLSLHIVIIEAIYLWTRNGLYLQMAKFWTRIFAVTFAVGVATGIVMEFEFGTNWATYSRYVGDVFGSALAAEGVFAFFLESGFLALLLFGWNKIGPKLHFFAATMVCLGAHFSAIWIVVANSWMQTPAGFHVVGDGIFARAEITSFWEMVFNPSSMIRLAHTVVGAWLAGSFMVTSVSAYYLLKKKFQDFAMASMKVGLSVAAVSVALQGLLGHLSGEVVAEYQPAKLAAFEGLYKTTQSAPLSIFGFPNNKTLHVDYEISIPGLLSFLTEKETVTGLDHYPREDWPNVPVVFQVYHMMIFMWGCMLILSVWGLIAWFRGTLWNSKWLLRGLVAGVIFPQIANQAGWVAAEMGRYPWIVQDLLRISQGLSQTISANQVLGSIILFGFVYTFLFIMFLYLLNEKFTHGPLEEDEHVPFHHLKDVVTKKNG